MNMLNSHRDATQPCLTPMNVKPFGVFILTQALQSLYRDCNISFRRLLTPYIDKVFHSSFFTILLNLIERNKSLRTCLPSKLWYRSSTSVLLMNKTPIDPQKANHVQQRLHISLWPFRKGFLKVIESLNGFMYSNKFYSLF